MSLHGTLRFLIAPQKSVAIGPMGTEPEPLSVRLGREAVDRQIAHGKIAGATFDLEFRPNCPDMPGPQWSLRRCQLVLISRHSFADCLGGAFS
jgi:hypothetical protein